MAAVAVAVNAAATAGVTNVGWSLGSGVGLLGLDDGSFDFFFLDNNGMRGKIPVWNLDRLQDLSELEHKLKGSLQLLIC